MQSQNKLWKGVGSSSQRLLLNSSGDGGGCNEPLVVLIVGNTNAGKTTIGEFINSELGWNHIEASSVLYELLEERGRRVKPSNIKNFMDDTDDIGIAEEVAERIDKQVNDPVVVTGFRSPKEIQYFLDNFLHVVVVQVTAPQKTRQRRALKKSSKPPSDAINNFESKEELDQELGLDVTLNTFPQYEIENSGSRSDLQREIERILTQINNCS